jgi:glucokinase
MESLYAIGIDLGATKIASALVSHSGQILVSRELDTDTASGPERVVERIAAEINSLAEGSPGRLAGIGVGSPGLLDFSEGVVKYALNLGWENIRLVDGIRGHMRANLPIWLEKDTNAMALGEYYFGSAQGVRNSLYFSIGSGLGAGIIVNGQVVPGEFGIAADIGHLSLDPQGRQCACGHRGCAETVVSGQGLVWVTKELIRQKGNPTRLQERIPGGPRQILLAALQGDELALKAFATVGEYLGIVMAGAVMLLNPGVIVIGGGLGRAAFRLLLPAAHKALNLRATPISLAGLQILPSSLSSSAVGAACLVWSKSDIRTPGIHPIEHGGAPA